MRRSEFDRAVSDEFGARAGALLTDLVLPQLGDTTAKQALASGVAPRDVWRALCVETDVPPQRHYGVGQLRARR